MVSTPCLSSLTVRLLNARIDIVKKQAEQNAREYDRLATEFNKANGNVSSKKAD